MPEVTWYYNDKPIKDDTEHRIIADLFDFSLTIHHTTPECSGKYSLKAKNNFGEEELSADLFVKGWFLLLIQRCFYVEVAGESMI